jgi:hypothetical protein
VSSAQPTGSTNGRADQAVDPVLHTPTPGVRRTNREGLARRRSEWLNAALHEARSHLERGNLGDALEACQRALTFDEEHAGALELEHAILTALDHTDASGVTGRDPSGAAMTAMTAMTVPTFAYTAPGSQAVHGPTGRPGDYLDAVSGVITLAPEPMARGTQVPPPAESPLPSPALSPPAGLPPADSRPSVSTPSGSAPSAPATSSLVARLARPRWALAAGGALVLVALVAAVLMTPADAAPSGTVVIDAVPWASVVSIETEGGEAVPLPQSASTPLQLRLPAGTYRVELAGPTPAAGTERVSVTVEAGATNTAPIAEFGSMTAEEYFEQYLGVGGRP